MQLPIQVRIQPCTVVISWISVCSISKESFTMWSDYDLVMLLTTITLASSIRLLLVFDFVLYMVSFFGVVSERFVKTELAEYSSVTAWDVHSSVFSVRIKGDLTDNRSSTK